MHWCSEKCYIHVYRGCEENNPLWTTIRLYEVVNLEELLNVTKVSFLTLATRGRSTADV